MWDAGLKYTEIAKRVGWNRNTEAIRIWHMRRNLPVPDGRTLRRLRRLKEAS